MAKKRETFKPVMTADVCGSALAGQKHLDQRIGEPTFFYILLVNPNAKMPRKFTLSVANTCDKLESIVKLITNFDEIDYWRTYGRIDAEVNIDGRNATLVE